MTHPFVLKAFGECKTLDDLDVAELEVDGARLMERADGIDARWTLEAGMWAPSQDAAEALAEEVMAAAQWEYGEWHGYEVRPVEKGEPAP